MPSEGARLHPLSVLVGVPLVQIVRVLIVPAFAVLAGGGADRAPLLALVLLGVVLGVRILAWRRFRWSFDGDVVRVEQGVLSRSRRVVDVDRIQQVELDRPFVQRVLGLATLRIETAGSDAGPEVELRVLGHDEAVRLREAIQPRARPHATHDATHDAMHDEAARSDVVLRLPLGQVALASVTGAQLLLAPALLTGLLQLAGDRTAELIEAAVDWLLALRSSADLPGAGAWVAGAVAVVIVAIATTLVVSVVRDGGFVVLRVGDDLVVRRGLLGTRESTVPLRRVQVVRVVANPLRRALGVATLRIHSAGGSSGDGSRRVTVPLVTEAQLGGLLADLLPDLAVVPALQPHPPTAGRRALWRRLRGLGGWLVPAAIGWALLAGVGEDVRRASPVPLPGWILTVLARDGAAWAVPLSVGAVLIVVQVVLARLELAALGHGVDAAVLAARSGALTHTLSLAPLARLQGVTRQATWFQARLGLATVRAHVAGPGGDVVVLDAAATDADRLHVLLAAAAAGTAGTRA